MFCQQWSGDAGKSGPCCGLSRACKNMCRPTLNTVSHAHELQQLQCGRTPPPRPHPPKPPHSTSPTSPNLHLSNTHTHTHLNIHVHPPAHPKSDITLRHHTPTSHFGSDSSTPTELLSHLRQVGAGAWGKGVPSSPRLTVIQTDAQRDA